MSGAAAGVPGDVAELAASVGGVALAWRYAETSVTIVLVDGRKLVFERARGEAVTEAPAPEKVHRTKDKKERKK